MRRLGVGLVTALLALVVAARVEAGAAPRIRTAVPADDVARGADAFHTLREWWTIRAENPANGDFVLVRLYDRPTPVLEAEVHAGAVADGAWDPALTLEPHSGPGVTLARPPELVSLSRVGRTYVLDSAYPTAAAHIVLTPAASGITVGPWQLPSVGVGGPPPTPVAGTLNWSVQVPAGRASGWIELDGRRVEFSGWSAYHDHVWGSVDRNWLHGDFALLTRPSGETWILNGLEPYAGDAYRSRGDDARWRGVLVHARAGRATACAARVARSGWTPVHSLGDAFTYFAPRTLGARCGGTSLSIAMDWSRVGVGEIDGIVRVGGPASGHGWFLHTTPQLP